MPHAAADAVLANAFCQLLSNSNVVRGFSSAKAVFQAARFVGHFRSSRKAETYDDES